MKSTGLVSLNEMTLLSSTTLLHVIIICFYNFYSVVGDNSAFLPFWVIILSASLFSLPLSIHMHEGSLQLWCKLWSPQVFSTFLGYAHSVPRLQMSYIEWPTPVSWTPAAYISRPVGFLASCSSQVPVKFNVSKPECIILPTNLTWLPYFLWCCCTFMYKSEHVNYYFYSFLQLIIHYVLILLSFKYFLNQSIFSLPPLYHFQRKCALDKVIKDRGRLLKTLTLGERETWT